MRREYEQFFSAPQQRRNQFATGSKVCRKRDRTLIGKDVMKVEYGWPLGMPVCRPLGTGLYEVRTDLSTRRIARVLFFIYRNRMVLLHGFIKKDQKTPKKDLTLARNRKRQVDNAS